MSSLSCFFLTKPSVANATIGRADTGQAEWLQMTDRISKSLNSLSRCRGMRDHRYNQLINKISTQTNELLAHLASSGSERLSDDGGQGEAQSIPPHVMDTLYRVMYHSRSATILEACIAFFLNIAKQGTEQSQLAVNHLVNVRKSWSDHERWSGHDNRVLFQLFNEKCMCAVKAHDAALQGEQQRAWRQLWFSAPHQCFAHRVLLQLWCSDAIEGREWIAMWQNQLWRRQLTHASLVADAYKCNELNEWMLAMVTHVSLLDDEPIRSSLIRETVDHIARMVNAQQSAGQVVLYFLIDFTTKMMNVPSVSIETKQYIATQCMSLIAASSPPSDQTCRYIATQCMSLIAASSPPSDQACRLLVNRFFVSCDVIVPHSYAADVLHTCLLQNEGAHLSSLISMINDMGNPYPQVRLLEHHQSLDRFRPHLWRAWRTLLSHPDLHRPTLHALTRFDQSLESLCGIVALVEGPILTWDNDRALLCIDRVVQLDDNNRLTADCESNINATLDALFPTPFQDQTETTFPTPFQDQTETTFPTPFQDQTEITFPTPFQDQTETTLKKTIFQDQTETTLKKTIDLLVIMKNTTPEGVSQHKVRALLQLLSKRYPALSQLCLISDQLSPDELTALVVDLLTTHQKPITKMPPVAGHQPIGPTTMPHTFEG